MCLYDMSLCYFRAPDASLTVPHSFPFLLFCSRSAQLYIICVRINTVWLIVIEHIEQLYEILHERSEVEELQAELSRVELALTDELHAERSAAASAHQRETAMLDEAERLHMEEAILNAAIVETLQSSEDVKVRIAM